MIHVHDTYKDKMVYTQHMVYTRHCGPYNPYTMGGVILVLLPPKNKTHKHTYTFQQWPIVDSTLACGLKAMLCLEFI